MSLQVHVVVQAIANGNSRMKRWLHGLEKHGAAVLQVCNTVPPTLLTLHRESNQVELLKNSRTSTLPKLHVQQPGTPVGQCYVVIPKLISI